MTHETLSTMCHDLAIATRATLVTYEVQNLSDEPIAVRPGRLLDAIIIPPRGTVVFRAGHPETWIVPSGHVAFLMVMHATARRLVISDLPVPLNELRTLPLNELWTR